MPERFALDPSLQLDELASYHEDLIASLGLYFSPSNPAFDARFAGKRIVRSAFFVLTRLEASFKMDFEFRCEKRLKDGLSRYFRKVSKRRKDAVRLDEDILEGWKMHSDISPEPSRAIGELRGAFKFRHWLAHGRYWSPKLGRRYDFDSIHLLASAIVSGFPFES